MGFYFGDVKKTIVTRHSRKCHTGRTDSPILIIPSVSDKQRTTSSSFFFVLIIFTSGIRKMLKLQFNRVMFFPALAAILALSYSGGNEIYAQAAKRSEQNVIRNLVANRGSIQRTYTNTTKGVETSTWSLEDNVSGWIKLHVQQMKALVESDSGTIRQWDALFRKGFEMRDLHHMEVNYTEHGVTVEQNGDNDCAVSVVQAHARVVSLFVERGREEAWLNHKVPEECALE